MTRRLVLAALAAALPLLAGALDAPHDMSQDSSCQDCHVGHNAPGAGLTTYAGNANLCDSCHKLHAGKFGFPWVSADQAVPGAGGRSHRWDADATARGAAVPLDPEMAKRVADGKIQCSTCHDQHSSGGRPGDADFKGGTQHVSVPIGVAQPHVSGTGSGQMTVNTVTAAAAPKGYRVEVQSRAGSTLTIRVSHDNGRTWFAAGTAPAGGAAVNLDDGANVKVSFPNAGNTYAAGDAFAFWISYPFLRVANVSSSLCEDCHRDRVQSAACVEGTAPCTPDGARLFSHPVGVAMSKPYDHPAPLDADGSANDGIASNDLDLAGDGTVRCLTCHAVHNVDSNSLTP